MTLGKNTPFKSKIKTIEEICELVGSRPRQHKVVMCHGVFDIVHPGHMRHLLFAKEHAQILVVSITADQHITKANFRPYVPEQLRALNLAAFEMVDYVVVDHDPTPLNNLRLLQPDLFAKGFEYSAEGVNPATRKEMDVIESYGGEMLFSPGDVVYSSSALIDAAPPNLAVETLQMTMAADGIEFRHLREALVKLQGIKVHLIGDTIVDTLTTTKLIGGLTKTPTFSVQVQEKHDYAGGASIVAKHLRAAGAEVVFSTVLGNDSLQKFVLDTLVEAGIDVRYEVEANRPTTNKNAIVAGGYRLLKIDTVDNRPIGTKVLERFCRSIRETPADIVMFSDFRHGIFNRDTIPVLTQSIPENTFKVADSQVASRWGNVLEFKGFDLITPNEREARFALGDQDSVIRPLASRLYDLAKCKVLILKLGERGILTQRASMGSRPYYFYGISSFVDRVVDPVGAGDALLAYSALALKATGSDLIASILGSLAAAVECEFDGNIPVTPKDVLAKIDSIEQRARLL